MKKEKLTIELMLKIYCKAHHKSAQDLCPKCEDLKKYAEKKLDDCVFGENKPVCSKCKVHCYSSEKRDLILKVMEFSGPKMVGRHPVLAVNHIFKSFKKLK